MVAHSFHNGDKAYIIDNVRFLREVIVLRVTRDLCVIRYIDNGAVIRIRRSRLFETEKEATDLLPPDARPKKKQPLGLLFESLSGYLKHLERI